MFVSTAKFMVAAATGDHKTLYTGEGQDAFPFPATWLSNTELLYTGDGHIFHVDLAAKSESPIPFTATIKSIRPQYPHKVYDFDSTAAHPVKGIFAPALSPDGKQIAFVALNQLYVMTIGSAPVALTNDTFFKQGPAWSPDGKTLAYVSDKDGIENIYLHDMSAASTTSDKRVSPSQEAQIMPAWSPDGKLIACQDHTGATVLLTVATGAAEAAGALHLLPGPGIFFCERQDSRDCDHQAVHETLPRGNKFYPHSRCSDGEDRVLLAGAIRIGHDAHGGWPDLFARTARRWPS